MGSILFVTDKYFPTPYANGNCVHQVAKSFVLAGYDTHVLAFEDPYLAAPKEKDGVYVHTVKPELRLRFFYYAIDNPRGVKSSIYKILGSIVSRVGKLLNIRQYPLSSKKFNQRIESKIKELHETYHYDIIVTTFCPLDGVVAGLNFKKKNPSVKWIIYNLDYLPAIKRKYISKKRVDEVCEYWEKQFFDTADKTLILEDTFNVDCESRGVYEKYREKIALVDVPLLKNYSEIITSIVDDTELLDQDAENWVYAGSMSHPNYGPEEAFQIFLGLPEDKKRVFHIFGRGNLMDLCKKYAERSGGKICVHEYVAHDELEKVLNKADILVSIKNTRFLSGKVSEYIASGSKVVHFSGDPLDADARYFERYSRGHVVRTYEKDTDSNIRVLVDKLREWDNEVLPNLNFDDFKMNYPEYTREIIIEA